MLLAGAANCLEAGQRSVPVALGLSIGVPIVGCYATWEGSDALFLTSLIVAPSLGHFYAGQWGRGLLFTSLRTLAVFGTTYLALGSGNIIQFFGFFYIGVSAYCLITLADWITVPFSAQKYNERFQIKPEIDLQHEQYGINLSYRF